jgi:DNA-binding NarL/FixJ family response regulator
LISSNAEATTWLSEVDPGRLLLSPRAVDRAWIPAQRTYFIEDAFPPAVIPLLARARAVAAGHEPGPARLRVRSRTGQWLVLHASCLGSPADSGTASTVAVVIEPAKSADIAPIIVEAYALSPRERDVVRAIARGLSSAEIAAELFQ